MPMVGPIEVLDAVTISARARAAMVTEFYAGAGRP